MAIVKKLLVPIYPGATLAPLQSVINSLQLPFVTSTVRASDDQTLTINFDSGITWKYTRSSEDWNRYLNNSITVLGQTYGTNAIHTMNTTGESATVTICASPTLLYIKIYTPWRERYLIGFYQKINDTLALSNVGINVTLSALGVRSSETSAVYELPAILNYSAGTNRIQYMNHSPVMSGGIKYYDLEDIYSCTTVASDAVLTFGGDNYYAVDTHLLIPLDPEQSNG